MSATVRDVMTRRVVAVRKDASFKEMAAMLRSSRISAFPVVDEAGRVIGVVSEADMLVKEAVQAQGTSLIAALRHIREEDKAAGITAGDLMTAPAVTIGPDAPVQEAARRMYDRRVKRLPVVNQAGKLVGIVSRADVLSVYSRPDAEIQQEITKNVILNEFFANPDHFTVTVKDGIVTLEGYPENTARGRDIVAEAWHVEGVVSVRDRLTYPEER